MDRARRELLLIAVFLVLLAFHLALLSRMVARGDALLSALLSLAIGLFLWRLAIHGRRYRTGARAPSPLGRAEEMKRIRTWVPILAALLVLHGWLLWRMVLVEEFAFAALLGLAVTVFVVRLVWYGLRWRALRTPAGRPSP